MGISGGNLVVASLKRHGVDTIFTLSGGHIFPIYDGCVKEKVRIIDTRHEQTAVFAAEGLARLTRRPGIAALTAGPGVTNGISAITSAYFSGSSLLIIGGRAPQFRWGSGSIQEIDHIPIVNSITKRASTILNTESIPAEIDSSMISAASSHRGPVFIDIPMDVLNLNADYIRSELPMPAGNEPDPDDIKKTGKLIAESSSPVMIAGTDVYWDGAWEAMRRFAETARVPVFMNGMGRGTLPADHELAFSRSRSAALGKADLIIVAGTPLDFRLRFGQFNAKVVHLADSPGQIAGHIQLAASASGGFSFIFDGLTISLESSDQKNKKDWIDFIKRTEDALRNDEKSDMENNSDPIHPSRIYGEMRKLLDRDAVVIGDGGDFVSYAGKYIDSFMPGLWLDPGPFGCLGTGLGYAIAARIAHPDKQVVLFIGDGALGFSAMDFDTLIRFKLPVVAVCGNNGIWGLEKHPMKMIYGYDVAADLQTECRYDKIVEALGGYGEFVTRPGEIGPAIDRAFKAGCPALVNIVTDPEAVYPRSSNLA